MGFASKASIKYIINIPLHGESGKAAELYIFLPSDQILSSFMLQSLEVSVQRILFHFKKPCQPAMCLFTAYSSSKQLPLEWYLKDLESAAANTLLLLLSN